MTRKILKIGFDLDGVLLYNPARVIRPITALLKKKKFLINRDHLEFYVPKPGLGQFFWELLHKSSMWLAPGFNEIKQLKKEKKIEAYLITGRFGHLQDNYDKWRKKMKADTLFVKSFMNLSDEQPHLFKERLIRELKLDFFIEDNWDIVQYLASRFDQSQQEKKTVKIIWLSNILDFKITYPYKVKSLKEALKIIQDSKFNT